LQLCVLRLGVLQDGDVGVGVFPEREEILVGGERPDAGGIGLPALNIKRIVRFAFTSLLHVRAVYPPSVLACFENMCGAWTAPDVRWEDGVYQVRLKYDCGLLSFYECKVIKGSEEETEPSAGDVQKLPGDPLDDG
jgi:hypothetical protein